MILAEKSISQSLIEPQRSRGAAAVIVRDIDGQTRLEDLFQQGCAKIRLPKTYSSKQLEAVMINTAGGLTGGDKLDWQFTSRKNSNLTVTTQACERVYQTSGGIAEISVKLSVENGACLSWLPQETILFDQCAVQRKIDVDLEGDARLLLVEPLIFGRKAMCETVKKGHFRDDWRIRKSGRLVHAESTCLGGDIQQLLHRKTVMDGNVAMATVLLLVAHTATDMETKLSQARTIIGSAGSVSFWEVGSTGKLLARLIAKDGYDLRKRLIPLITLLNDDAPLPKSWAI